VLGNPIPPFMRINRQPGEILDKHHYQWDCGRAAHPRHLAVSETAAPLPCEEGIVLQPTLGVSSILDTEPDTLSLKGTREEKTVFAWEGGDGA
jgi:hypothetical protein